MAKKREVDVPSVRGRSRHLSEEEIASRRRQEKEYARVKAKKRRRRKTIVLVLEGLVLLVLLGIVFLLGKWDKIIKADFSKSQVKINEDLAEDTVQVLRRYRTIAVFGTDARDMKTEKGHSDVVMLVCINNETGDIKLLSVFRDTFMNDAEDTSAFRKLTTMYWRDGALGGLGALNRNLDLNVTEYVAVNWYAVAHAIDLLGGIDLEVPESMMKYINGYIQETVKSTGIYTDPSEGDYPESDYILTPGYQHLNGVQAVAFCRIRYIDNDYGRAERQRQVVSLALEKAKSNPAALNSIANEVFGYVSTNLEISDILSLAGAVARFNIIETAGFPFDRQSKTVDGASFVFPQGLEQNVIQLHKFLYGTEDYKPSGTVKFIDEYIKEYSGIGEP